MASSFWQWVGVYIPAYRSIDNISFGIEFRCRLLKLRLGCDMKGNKVCNIILVKTIWEFRLRTLWIKIEYHY